MSLHIVNKLTELDGIATLDSVTELFSNIDSNITIKKFTADGNLLLVHNSFYSTKDIDIYNECRSFVVKISDNNAKIIAYTHETMPTINTSAFTKGENDILEEGFEGTLVNMFYDDDKWYFCTSRCTDMDASYFHDTDTTFGEMFDQCLREFDMDRDSFTSQFDKTQNYNFVIVHHYNKYVIDYNTRFGNDYAKLILVATYNGFTRVTSNEYGNIITPQRYDSVEDCTNIAICRRYDESRNTYKYLKLQTIDYTRLCNRKPKFANNWYSYIHIFTLNDSTFTIDDFRRENNIVEEYTMNNKKIDIVGMIHLLYKRTATTLMNLINHFTDFDHANNSFTKKNTKDYQKLSAILGQQIAVFQGLIRKGTIRTASNAVSHLRKYVTTNQFINIIKAINDIKDESFCNINDEYYQNYVTFLLSRINKSNHEII